MSTNQDEIQDSQNLTVDYFSHGSPEKEFVNDLKKIFVVYKKCHGLSAMLVDCFEKSIDPFFVSLSLAYNSFDYNQSKPSSLTYTVLEEFASWMQPRMGSLGHLLTKNIKMNAFKLASGQKNKTVALLIVNTYQLKESNVYFINNIRDMLENYQYKEACELVKILNLQQHFNIYDFLVPLFLQDKLNVIDEFLIDNTAYQIAFLKFLDSLIIENNLSSKISKLMSDLKMPEAPVNILCKLNNIKALNRYIKRLVSDLNLSKDIVPNYSKRSECKSLSYLVHKRFSDKTLSEESFRELVVDLVKENQEVAKEFLLKLALVGANSEAVHWCQVLNVPITEMPLSVQDYHENITRGDGSTVVESKDDDWEELNIEEFHALSLPSSAITFVCNEAQLLSMLSSEFFNGVPHPGIPINQPEKISGTASVVSGSVNMVSGGAALVSGAAALVAGGVSRVAASSAQGRVNPAVEDYSQLMKIYGSIIAAPDSSLVGPGGTCLVALDCEWKPTVGRGKTDLSLLQLATPSSVYILDMISLNSCHQHWDQLVSNLFNNHDVLKIGFSLHTDMMYLSTYFDCDYSNFGCNLLDLADLWFKLSTEYHFVFPFTDESQENSNSLSRLVYLCLGKNLDKKERFSNWELRPLRETQIQYAALDSFCLIEVYNVLKHLCTNRGLPFDDIVNEVVQKYGEKISKKKKKSEDAPRRDKEIKVLNAKPISVDGVSLICDKSVMGLAKKLRRCGISADTLDPDSSPKELIEKAQKENKVILVKGNSFIKMKESLPQNQVYKVKTLNPDSQFIEVLNYFNFSIKNEDIFSRCLECNSNCMEKCTREVVESWHKNPLEEAPAPSTFVPAGYESEVLQDDYDDFYEDCHDDDYIPSTSVQPALRQVSTKLGCPIKIDVPDAILRTVNSFYLCQSCGKIYWNEGQFDQILGTLNSSFISP